MMAPQIIIAVVLNFIISLIGTLAYSVRLVGIRTGRIAISFALFNVLSLISRLAVTFQAPLLTKYVEENQDADLKRIFIIIIFISGLSTIIGAFLIPTFQKVFSKGVSHFTVTRSIPKLIVHSFSKSGIKQLRSCVAIPVKESITQLELKKLPKKTIVLNIITVAIITAGTFAPIYAGSIEHELRATCIALAPIISGIAAIIMTVFIDPQLSIMTDDVVDGNCTPQEFRNCVIGMVGSKTIGTFLAVFLLVPAAYVIILFARII